MEKQRRGTPTQNRDRLQKTKQMLVLMVGQCYHANATLIATAYVVHTPHRIQSASHTEQRHLRLGRMRSRWLEDRDRYLSLLSSLSLNLGEYCTVDAYMSPFASSLE